MTISSDKDFRAGKALKKDRMSCWYRLAAVAVFVVPMYLLFFTSCANQGVGPAGGPKDTIPPVIVHCMPLPHQTNFTDKEIVIAYDEYVVADNLSENLVISPPLAKKPSITTRGKSVVLKMDEDLIPDRTYSFDFGQGIKDYNEGNKIDYLRLVFSTGPTLDTLRISGHIYDSQTFEPVSNALATLYSVDSDSLFQNLRPDFIARADDNGYFIFDNLPAGEYKLFGLKDEDKNYYFSNVIEQIAFTEGMQVPIVSFVEKTDTVISGNDTIVSNGYYEYSPQDIELILFEDDYYSQFMSGNKRETKDKCLFVFNEPVTDSLRVNVVGYDSLSTWSEVEYSAQMDSVFLWITDSLLLKKDTLFFQVMYKATDSLDLLTERTDTLRMLYKPSSSVKPEKRDTSLKSEHFTFSTNLAASGFDLNKKVIVEAPSPVVAPVDSLFHLEKMINDSTLEAVAVKVKPVEGSKRKFVIDFKMEENTRYQLSVDTGVVYTYTRIPNFGFVSKFATQKSDFYGKVVITLTGFEGKGIVRLIKNGEKETIVGEILYDPSMKQVVFDYLKPEKYLVKLIDDQNGNGKWDTGKLSEKRQPEPVYYLQKEIAVKQNWEMKEEWILDRQANRGKAFTKQTDGKEKPIQKKNRP